MQVSITVLQSLHRIRGDVLSHGVQDVESKRRRLLAGEHNHYSPDNGSLSGSALASEPNTRSYACAACEERLEILKKEYLPALAREHGISKEFCAALKVCPHTQQHTVDAVSRTFTRPVHQTNTGPTLEMPWVLARALGIAEALTCNLPAS